MSRESEIKAQKSSLVSSMIALLNKEHGTDMDRDNPDDRASVAAALAEATNLFLANRGAEMRWEALRHEMYYDVYLAKKAEKGGCSRYDMVREDLVPSQFSHEDAYVEHRERIKDAKQKQQEAKAALGFKVCSDCGQNKPVTKFKRGGVCNSCRAKQYRERKKNEG